MYIYSDSGMDFAEAVAENLLRNLLRNSLRNLAEKFTEKFAPEFVKSLFVKNLSTSTYVIVVADRK